MTRRETAARNRRDLHKRRIEDQPSLVRKIAQAWAWVFAEVRDLARPRKHRWKPKGRPVEVVLSEVLDEVVALAARLNDEGGKR